MPTTTNPTAARDIRHTRLSIEEHLRMRDDVEHELLRLEGPINQLILLGRTLGRNVKETEADVQWVVEDKSVILACHCVAKESAVVLSDVWGKILRAIPEVIPPRDVREKKVRDKAVSAFVKKMRKPARS